MNKLFGASEVRELKGLVELGMTAKLKISTPSGALVETDPGVFTSSDVDTVVNTKCSLAPAASPNEVVTAATLTVVTEYLIKVPAGTFVSARSVLEATEVGLGVPSPLVFEVVGPYYKTTEFARWILARLVREGGG